MSVHESYDCYIYKAIQLFLVRLSICTAVAVDISLRVDFLGETTDVKSALQPVVQG